MEPLAILGVIEYLLQVWHSFNGAVRNSFLQSSRERFRPPLTPRKTARSDTAIRTPAPEPPARTDTLSISAHRIPSALALPISQKRGGLSSNHPEPGWSMHAETENGDTSSRHTANIKRRIGGLPREWRRRDPHFDHDNCKIALTTVNSAVFAGIALGGGRMAEAR
jgi:hypothetical protein